MGLTALILFIVFGAISVSTLLSYMFEGLNRTGVFLMIFSVFTTAVTAGIIWDGLLT